MAVENRSISFTVAQPNSWYGCFPSVCSYGMGHLILDALVLKKPDKLKHTMVFSFTSHPILFISSNMSTCSTGFLSYVTHQADNVEQNTQKKLKSNQIIWIVFIKLVKIKYEEQPNLISSVPVVRIHNLRETSHGKFAPFL